MADTPERKVKKRVTDLLKRYGAYYFYPVTGGYGMSGVPDIVACYNGCFFGIECKAGKNKPTELQKQNLGRFSEEFQLLIYMRLSRKDPIEVSHTNITLFV